MRKLILTAAALAGITVLSAALLGLLVDEEAFEHTLVQTLTQHTGRAVAVNGGTDISIFPLPAVTVKEVFIGNTLGGYAGYMASAKAIHGRLQLGALLKGEAKLGSLVIDGLELNLEITKKGEQNWRFTPAGATVPGSGTAPQPAPAVAGFDALGIPDSIRIASGTISYQQSAKTEKHVVAVSDLALDISALPALSLDGALSFRNTEFALAAQVSDVRSATAAIKGSVTSAGHTTLAFDGTGLFDLFEPRFTGNASLESTDAGALTAVFLPTRCERAAEAAPLPLTLIGKIAFTPTAFAIENGSLTSASSRVKLTAQYEATPSPAKQTLAVAVNIDTLDLDPILPEYQRLFSADCRVRSASAPEQPSSTAFDIDNRMTLLPDTMEAKFTASAKQIRINQRDVTDLLANAQANGGSIVINQLSGNLPGGTKLNAFGLLSQRADTSITFDGGMEASGQKVRDILEWLNVNLNTSNPNVLGPFNLKAAFALSGTEIRLTEASGSFDQTRFSGVTVTNFGANPSSEIRVRFDQFSLDDYMPPITEDANQGLELRGAGTARNPVEWVRKVVYKLRFGIGANQFTFAKRRYDNLYGVGTIENQKLTLDDFRFTLDTVTHNGKMSIDTSRKVPYFTADITSSTFDTGFIFQTQQPTGAEDTTMQASQKWSGGKFDFSLLQRFDGTFTLKAPQLVHDGVRFENVTVNGKLGEGVLKIDPLIGTYANGEVLLRGDIGGGAIPTMNLSFSVSNAEAKPFLQYFPASPVSAGRMSVRGALKSTGINLYSWMINMEGSIAVSARNLVFSGADITGFARRLTNIRSVADVVTVAKQAFTGGETVFRVFDGGMVIEKGTATISNLQLQGEGMQGVFRGRIDLPHWTGVGLAELKMMVAGSTDTPTLALKMSGGVDQPEVKVETADVETFIARRATQQGLKPQ